MSRGVEGNRVELGQRLRFIRDGLRLTQAEMARNIAISASHYSKLEIGASGMGRSLAHMLCEKFSIDEEWLLTGCGERPVFDGDRRHPSLRIPRELREGTVSDYRGLTDDVLANIVRIVLDPEQHETAQILADKLHVDIERAWLLLLKEALRLPSVPDDNYR